MNNRSRLCIEPTYYNYSLTIGMADTLSLDIMYSKHLLIYLMLLRM